MLRTPILLVCLLPALALGQTVGAPLHGKSLVIDNGPGDQTDPHVSGPVVAYTQRLSISSSEIRYRDVLTGQAGVIPNEGGFDSSADVSGDTVVFTRTTGGNRVYRFNVRKGGTAEELAPRTGADRRAVAIGKQTVAWQELGYTAGSRPAEIFAYRMDPPAALTLLTDDLLLDKTPAVSADGSAVVWVKCATSIDGCDVWSARAVEGGYEVTQLTGTEGEESTPDSNGEVAVYVISRTVNGVLESDIAWQPVGGGQARVLPLPGTDSNPNISGPLIAFEQKDSSGTTSNVDVMLYDLRTQTYYRLTDTPESETLSDISVEPGGLVRVVWAVRQDGELNVYAYVFRLPTDCASTPTIENPAAVCSLPGARPLLGTLQVTRPSGASEVVSLQLEARGTGVLCVDNGYKGTPATAGWVWLGPGLHVGPESFGLEVPGVAKAVPLQGGFKLSARADGVTGSAFQVRVYGEPSCDVGLEDDIKGGGELRYGQLVPSVPQGSGGAKGRLPRTFVPSGYEGLAKAAGSGSGTGGSGLVEGGEAPLKPFPGCGVGGGPVSLLGVWLLAAVSLRDRSARTRARAAARR
jgi:Tol biopolymer transport system component